MKKQKRIRDYGIHIGNLPTGPLNSITDVSGVKVGHATLDNGPVKTGVTAILPHGGNVFREKVMAASHVINGYGKTMGTIQIEELGTIETPIILTNTLSIGAACEGLIEYMLRGNEDIGLTTSSLNPVVCECNDSHLNDIRGRHVKPEHVLKAIDSASVEFEEGAVGAGTGMSCLGLKGGIGTSSRVIYDQSGAHTLGVLVMSNFGLGEDLTINGDRIGNRIAEDRVYSTEKGSIIIIIATDIPLSERQLKRVCKRATVGLVRCGSFIGNGSGDVVIGFTTANKINHYENRDLVEFKAVNENKIDYVFRAAAEACEEAILNSMICAETTVGRDGNTKRSLREFL